MKKVYYLLKMIATSPLRIGGGGNENSDIDLILDGMGIPFIPGSSLAGVIRNMMLTISKNDSSDNKYCITSNDVDELFGYVESSSGNDDPQAYSSKILINDGVIESNKKEKDIRISVRDGVGLDEWGMAIPGAKYDFEVSEINAPLYAIIECNYDNDIQEHKFERVLSIIGNEGIALGARTSRGYGKMKCEIKKRSFSIPDDLDDWLNFNPYNYSYEGIKEFTPSKNDTYTTTIKINLKMMGDFIIRVREANAVVREDGTNPDEVTIKNMMGRPIIPGTAWAGCFRHHMESINRELNGFVNAEIIDKCFGMGETPKDNVRSLITFSESIIDGGTPIVTMRNSVDRFTAAPTGSALFVNESWCGGDTTLTFSFNSNMLDASIKQLLVTAIYDLDNGMLSIGGNSSVGKGIMKITRILINNDDRTQELRDYRLSI